MSTKIQSSSETIILQDRNASDLSLIHINEDEDEVEAVERELRLAAKFK